MRPHGEKKEEKTRAERWSATARHGAMYVNSLTSYAAGQLGFLAAKTVDALQYTAELAKEQCCSTRPDKKRY